MFENENAVMETEVIGADVENNEYPMEESYPMEEVPADTSVSTTNKVDITWKDGLLTGAAVIVGAEIAKTTFKYVIKPIGRGIKNGVVKGIESAKEKKAAKKAAKDNVVDVDYKEVEDGEDKPTEKEGKKNKK